MQNTPADRISPISQFNFINKITLDISKNCKYQNTQMVKASILYTIKEKYNNIYNNSLKNKIDETNKNTLIMINITKEDIIKNTNIKVEILHGLDLNRLQDVNSDNLIEKLFTELSTVFTTTSLPDRIKNEILQDYDDIVKEISK